MLKTMLQVRSVVLYICNGATVRSDAEAGAGEARRIARFHG